MVLTTCGMIMRKPTPLDAIINGFELIKDLGFNKNKTRKAIFKCKVCGANFESQVQFAKIRPSCGCLGSHKRKNIEGHIINGFKILKDLGYDHQTKFKSVIAECKVCHKEYKVAVNGLKNRTSCGCTIKGTKVSKYTYSHRNILYTLRRMKSRCYKLKNKDYYNYGARGISVCEEWLQDQDNFVEWALSNGWKEGLSIDRIDNDKGYEPLNCRWVPMIEQARNKRTNVLNLEIAKIIRTEISLSTVARLAKKYNTSQTNIRNVIAFKTWKE